MGGMNSLRIKATLHDYCKLCHPATGQQTIFGEDPIFLCQVHFDLLFKPGANNFAIV
jgi:hypothetical protein